MRVLHRVTGRWVVDDAGVAWLRVLWDGDTLESAPLSSLEVDQLGVLERLVDEPRHAAELF